MQPHTRALLFAFIRQTRGALAAVELWIAEEDKLVSECLQTNKQDVTLHLPAGNGTSTPDKRQRRTSQQ